MSLDRLSKVQEEKLCRVSRQGMLQAAEMLSQLLRQTVEVEVADAWMSDGYRLPEQTGDPHLGVSVKVCGDIDGGLLLAFSEDCARWLTGRLLGTASDDLLVEPASSTLKEVGNILASSFLASLDDQLELRVMPSPPQLSRAQLEELLQASQPRCEEACLIVRTRLQGTGDEGENLRGDIYLLPEPETLEKIQDLIAST